MKKQTVLITGANKGIGLESARQLLNAGCHVFLGCRDKVRGDKAVAELKAEGLADVELLLIDVVSEESVQKAYDELAGRIEYLDVLINNAGIPGDFPQMASNTPDQIFKAVFEVNLFGVARTVRIFVPLMHNSPNPRIVNVTSDLGSLTLHNDPSWEHYQVKSSVYGPSKSALNAYTVALAYELKDKFKVNMINPGYTNTEFNNNQGPKPVEDGAKPIVEYAMLDADGPTGKYMSDYGESPW
ncbi:SDR family NAD(P)-dependent oxidoreductase [Mucilaginibacter glaciei]|uniref:SDR family NAD(P)-dependent oxidoreductase n=1 Tax=Mucilaginibacter glaciei TaxID=2772109 RepID=A0A926S2Q1_9SPHI|nr:SDR family NAD(P)-dependent oxidoreductase [Mucilaginibacter glaciei]MBD1394388.1 SDR family NAD(P)-dependent oxidoreductase [Mucilaginibacter glaciei]